MINVSAIMGAAKIVLSAFWAALRDFVLDAVRKVSKVLAGAAVDAVNLFVQESSDGLHEIAYNYIKDGERYLEKVAKKRINEGELPKNIKSRLKNSFGEEIDITNDFARELNLS